VKLANPVILFFSLLALAAAPAHAQQVEPPAPQSETVIELSVNKLVGQKVTDAHGRDLGQITDVVMDMQAGKVYAAVLEYGGFLGMRAKQYAFPFDELARGKDKNRLTVNVDKEMLENAEGFAKAQWPAIDRAYWGRVGGPRHASAGDTAPQAAKPILMRANDLIGEPVQDNRGRKVGKVSDVVVNLGDGKLRHLAIDVDGAGSASLPPDALTIGTEKQLVINMGAEQLKGQAKQPDGKRQAREPQPPQQRAAGDGSKD
jgi:sporulation protein YlmC with PRC-barrel domain